MIQKSIFTLAMSLLLTFTTSLFSSYVQADSNNLLPTGNKVSGEITKENTSQTFEVNLNQPGKLTIDFTSYLSEVYIELLDAEGNRVISRKNIYTGSPENPKKWTASEYLEAGTYYIKVNQYGSYIGTYNLLVDHQATNNNETEPNNGTAQAPVLDFKQTVNGLISWSDNNDTHKIVVPKPGKTSFNLSSSLPEVYLDVLDSEGNRVFSRKNIYTGSPENPKKWAASEYLEAGTYYVQISQYGSYTGTYDLTVDHLATNNIEAEPNNGTAEAQSLDFNKKVTGLISWSDNNDSFKIVVPKPGEVRLNFDSYLPEVYLDLFDSKGNRVFSRQNIYTGSPENPKKWAASEYLEAGTYYVQISQYGSYTGTYELSAHHQATNNNEAEPNNGTEQAKPLPLNKLVTGLISWSDDSDYYKIVMTKAGKVNLSVSSYLPELYLDLYETNGDRVISRKNIYTGSPENPKKWNEEVELSAGTYYIGVNKYSNYTGKYSLFVQHGMELKDVKAGDFYYDAVMMFTSSGVISGYGDGTFRPNQTLSRAHAILLLKKALKLEVPQNYKEIANRFSDVGQNHLYAKEAAAVYQAGIFMGSHGKMGMNNRLTREQMASVLVRAYKLKDNPSTNGLANVTDLNLISSSHLKNVEILYETNITTGKMDGRYAPRESVTRGQFVTFLSRAMQ